MSQSPPSEGATLVDCAILWTHAMLVGVRDRSTNTVARLRSVVGTSSGTESGATPTMEPSSDDCPDSEVVTTEAEPPMCTSEKILVTVDREGGRMWQTDIVEAVGCSSSTVSRHLSALESKGEIQRVTVGREKIVALPDYEFEATRTMQSEYDAQTQAA
ncbi:helix-turn-helix transcriptional regulator [Haloarchaeobius sp. TZWSO28]|uniref:helix-turn-helix transcriptional regulator n=1 Tax=Haloarchaeobius sp. TZWSO28 TaxID=3446119 RepID=UPI003EBD5724